MQEKKTPCWFQEKLKLLAQTGKLDLSGEAFDDLSFVGSRASMKQIDLSFTPIQTIEGLQLQPRLDTLLADSSELANFKNFRSVQKISTISIKNTPVSHLPNFKLSLLIVIGPTLRVINGQYISQKIREKAASYPPIASDLVNCGWIAEYPCPNQAELDLVSQSYGLAEVEEDLTESQISGKQQSAINFERTVDAYTSIHKNLIQQAHQQIETASINAQSSENCSQKKAENSLLNGLEGDEYGLNLCDKVQILLKHHGYDIDQTNRTESMIGILSELLIIDDKRKDEEELVAPNEEEYEFVGEEEEEEEAFEKHRYLQLQPNQQNKQNQINLLNTQNLQENEENNLTELDNKEFDKIANEDIDENEDNENEDNENDDNENEDNENEDNENDDIFADNENLNDDENFDDLINNSNDNNENINFGVNEDRSESYSSGSEGEGKVKKTPSDLRWEKFVAQVQKDDE